LTDIWKLNNPNLTLFFQCGSNYKRFIDEESPFYQTRALWLLTNGKLPDTTRDSEITYHNPRKTENIAICSVDEFCHVTSEDSQSISFNSAASLDSDCRVFLFVDNGPCPKDQAMQIFRSSLANYLQNGNVVENAIILMYRVNHKAFVTTVYISLFLLLVACTQ